MTFIYSDEILKEFVRLSEQQRDTVTEPVTIDQSQFELLQNTNNDLAIEGQPTFVTAAIVSNAEDDAKTILEKKYPMEPEDMIERAHPEPVMVAQHPYGGLVENQNEQHERIVNIVNKMPTGFPLHSWASITSELVKIAQECDELGLTKEAKALDEIVDSFFFRTKHAGVMDFLGKSLSKVFGPSMGVILPFLSNPWTVGIVAGLALGGVTFWTLWDGIKEDLTTDIKDLIDELNDYNNDPDFNQVPGFQQMLGAAQIMQQLHSSLLIALSDRAGAKTPENIARAAQLYDQIGDQIDILNSNYPLFEASAPKNMTRNVVGFGNIHGRIKDLDDLYSDLGKAAGVSHTAPPTTTTPSAEHDKSVPGTSAPLGNPSDIKKFLREHDVSKIVGYQYELDNSAEFDSNTRRVLSDLGDHIRQQLGTSTPSTRELMSSSYDGLEKLMQIYHEPWNFVKSK